MCCGVAAIVLSDSAAYLTGYVASTDTPENTITIKFNKKTNMQALKQVSKMGPHCPQFSCDVIMSATSGVGRVCSARTPLEVPKRTKEIRHV